MNELLILFIVLNAINVVIQTVKSLCTINCGKTVAALVNALAYGFYTVVVIYMVCDLPLLWKVLIVGACNFIGVFLVKWAEEKMRKDKLWKIEATVYEPYTKSLDHDLKKAGIPHNYIENVGKYTVFNLFCETQTQSKTAREILDRNKAKFFVSESKNLY